MQFFKASALLLLVNSVALVASVPAPAPTPVPTNVEPAVKKDFFDSIGNFVENVGDRIGDRVHNSTENIRNNTRDLFSDPDHNGAEPLMIGSTFWAGFAGTVMVGAGLLF